MVVKWGRWVQLGIGLWCMETGYKIWSRTFSSTVSMLTGRINPTSPGGTYSLWNQANNIGTYRSTAGFWNFLSSRMDRETVASYGLRSSPYPFLFFFSLKIYLFAYLFIYLFYFLAASGLSCGTWDLHWGMWDLSLRHVGSFVVAHGLLSSCGVWVFSL